MLKGLRVVTLLSLFITYSALSDIENLYDQFLRAYPVYLGIDGGWGTTDWHHFIAKANTADELSSLSLSLPISANDSGIVYGAYLGIEISPFFAMELNYMRFPETTVIFENQSLYFMDIPGQVNMPSSTYAYNLVGKFMVPIGHSHLRGFANAGAGLIHRRDVLVDTAHVGPTFGIGLNEIFLSRLMLELAFQYYAGFGKATFEPAFNFIPFLNTVHLKLSYRF